MLLTYTNASFAQNNKKDKKKVEQVVFTASMNCQSCANKITEALYKVKGVRKVNANAQTKVIKVDFRPNIVQKETIIETVKNLGFVVKVE